MRLTTRAQRLITRGGLLELFKGICRFIYWHAGLRKARYTLSYGLNGSPVTCTVDEITARFKASTTKEYARIRTLHGERAVVADLLQTLNRDDVFYDVGANVGIYACFAGQALDTGSVIAFEPHPANVDRLQENAALNDVNVIVQSLALSNEVDTSELAVVGAEDEAGAGTHSLSTGYQRDTIEIKTTKGDRLIKDEEIPPPSVVKIDVEGAEQRVIEGLSSALKSERCHTVYCEVHPDRISEFGGSIEEVEELLECAGYSIDVIEDRSPEYFVKAERVVE